MSFELQVHFTGLCLFVIDTTQNRVGVLMPDAREHSPIQTLPDDDVGRTHIGYVRFDLANFDSRFRPAGGKYPLNEGVHQFTGEELLFEIAFASGHGPGHDPFPPGALKLPEFEKIAPPKQGAPTPSLVLKQGMFVDRVINPGDPPEVRLMRTLLEGGTLTGTFTDEWYFPNLFAGGQKVYREEFAGAVTWKCQVESVTLKLRKFNTPVADAILIPLTSVPDSTGSTTVHVQIANVCDVNPLEWVEFESRETTFDDVDFKWLYTLVEPATGETWKGLLLDDFLPHPRVPRTLVEGVEGCVGASIKGSTT